MMVSARRTVTLLLGVLLGMLAGVPLLTGVVWANTGENHLYPDVFPYVDEGGLTSLENWTIDGNTLDLRTVFANQGAGLFEIRRGAAVPGDPNRDRLIQRVYIGTDGGGLFEDTDIGTTPRPSAISGNLPDGRPGGNEAPFSSNAIGTERIIWFEDFTRFSLHVAVPEGDGFSVGAEVAGNTKASFALQATSALPGTTPNTEIESPNNFFQLRISPGFGDLYIANDPGNEIDIAGVDRDAGFYWLRQTVDPENRIAESNEDNNSFEVLIDLRGSGAILDGNGSFVQPVPEPGTLAYLACLGVSSLALSRRRWRKR